jgi:hypothetical protein
LQIRRREEAPQLADELARLRSVGVDDPEDDPTVLVEGSPDSPQLWFQRVPEPKTVKDRIHLDLHFDPDQRDAEVERILALGATKLWDGQQGPHTWVTLADPEGNEFCVA